MINYIIIEEEKLGASIIKNYFDNLTSFNFLGYFTNPYEVLQKLKDQEVQIVFINYTIENNALEFIRAINREVFPLFVVMSDTSSLALGAVRVINMVDFILKPVTSTRLNDTLKIIDHALKLRLSKSVFVDKDHIFVKVDKRKIRINLEDIYYLESVKDYVRIVTKTKRYLVYKTLTAFSEELSERNFMRVHRSYGVSLDKVKAIDGFYLEILDKKIPVSRKYVDELRSRLLITE